MPRAPPRSRAAKAREPRSAEGRRLPQRAPPADSVRGAARRERVDRFDEARALGRAPCGFRRIDPAGHVIARLSTQTAPRQGNDSLGIAFDRSTSFNFWLLRNDGRRGVVAEQNTGIPVSSGRGRRGRGILRTSPSKMDEGSSAPARIAGSASRLPPRVQHRARLPHIGRRGRGFARVAVRSPPLFATRHQERGTEGDGRERGENQLEELHAGSAVANGSKVCWTAATSCQSWSSRTWFACVNCREHPLPGIPPFARRARRASRGRHRVPRSVPRASRGEERAVRGRPRRRPWASRAIRRGSSCRS